MTITALPLRAEQKWRPPFASAAIIAGMTIAALVPASCDMDEKGAEIASGDYTAPTLESVSVTGSDGIRMEFTRPVTVTEPSISPEIEIEEIGYSQPEDGGGTCLVDVSLGGEMEVGEEYVISGTVVDSAGNSLTFSQEFTGFNDSLPEVEITEVHPMYDKGTVKGQDVYKNEFIELHALSDGNLSGLELFSAYDGEKKIYSLPAVAVKKDEVVVVHLRTKGEGCVNETGSDLSLATAKYSSGAVRDLWSENEDARLGDKMDVILLRNADGRLLDAVLYACEADTEWQKAAMKAAAESAVGAGLWGPDASVSSAARADDITASRSLVKAKGKTFAGAWSVTATNKETPGAL